MNKTGLVFCIHPDQYEIFDERIVKPTWYREIENGEIVGSMVLQELDQITFQNRSFEFFVPNNIAMLLSINKRYSDLAKGLFDQKINPKKVTHLLLQDVEDKKGYLQNRSIDVANYIELIQVSIVFGYTAIEAFINLSIPDDYKYEVKIKNKGISEVYDKTAIERWISLDDKVVHVLTSIYKTAKVESQSFWSNFKTLEKFRHDIIHQKSISRTDFYKDYFNEKIFNVIRCPEQVLQFFFDAHAKENRTNPLWPWSIGKEKVFPVKDNFPSAKLEVVGNLHEGFKNKKRK